MSTQEPIIRIMKEGDLDRIIEIDNKVLGERRPDYWERKFEMAGKKSPLPSLVAETEGKIVGFIFGEASGWEYGVPENIGWIDTIGVDPTYQKKGIGGLLMKELLSYMKKVGVDTVYTLVNWRDWELLRFFDAIGFKRGDMINLEYQIPD
ncbi:MAG: GNAT family N-acetyltransferase [Candidatus Heimdallarchaeota archaeon]|nr:MAG: GNAT family N-acetyltransferase [Candidatus Heimdallarchaeota archaeon]